jgi:hypothetical protein
MARNYAFDSKNGARGAADVSPTPALMRSIGKSLAYLDLALSDYEYDGDQQPLLWDMQRAPYLIQQDCGR